MHNQLFQIYKMIPEAFMSTENHTLPSFELLTTMECDSIKTEEEKILFNQFKEEPLDACEYIFNHTEEDDNFNEDKERKGGDQSLMRFQCREGCAKSYTDRGSRNAHEIKAHGKQKRIIRKTKIQPIYKMDYMLG